MRLSKRQLKRIIREEYSRLKRRGLISETNFMAMGAPYDTEEFSDWTDAVEYTYMDDPRWCTSTLAYLWEEDIEELLDEDADYYVREQFKAMGEDTYGVCASLVDISMRNGKPESSVIFLMNKFVKFAKEEKGYDPADF